MSHLLKVMVSNAVDNTVLSKSHKLRTNCGHPGTLLKVVSARDKDIPNEVSRMNHKPMVQGNTTYVSAELLLGKWMHLITNFASCSADVLRLGRPHRRKVNLISLLNIYPATKFI